MPLTRDGTAGQSYTTLRDTVSIILRCRTVQHREGLVPTKANTCALYVANVFEGIVRGLYPRSHLLIDRQTE